MTVHHRVTTPGLLGYVLAVLIAVGVLGLEIGVVLGHGVVPILQYAMIAWIYCALVALAAGPIAVLLVHLLCYRIRFQLVHVAVSALLGALVAGVVLWAIGALPAMWGLPPMVALAAGIGRAAVIPLVRRQA